MTVLIRKTVGRISDENLRKCTENVRDHSETSDTGLKNALRMLASSPYLQTNHCRTQSSAVWEGTKPRSPWYENANKLSQQNYNYLIIRKFYFQISGLILLIISPSLISCRPNLVLFSTIVRKYFQYFCGHQTKNARALNRQQQHSRLIAHLQEFNEAL